MFSGNNAKILVGSKMFIPCTPSHSWQYTQVQVVEWSGDRRVCFTQLLRLQVTGNHIPLASAMAGNFVSLNSRFQCPQPYVGGTLVPVIVPSDGIWSKVFE